MCGLLRLRKGMGTHSLTVLPTAPSAAPRKPHPLPSAPTGSSRKSSSPGRFLLLSGLALPPPPPDPDDGVNDPALPKPWYLPPWLGGRWSGRLSLAAPIREKKSSFCALDGIPPLALPPAGEPERGVEPAEDSARAEPAPTRGLRSEPVEERLDDADADEGAGGSVGTQGRPSASATSFSRYMLAMCVLYWVFIGRVSNVQRNVCARNGTPSR